MLRKLLSRCISKNQILILNELKNNKSTITNIISIVSKKYNLSPSTVRYNIEKLKELDLIECGNSKQKGIPAKLTDSGILILDIIGDRSSVGERYPEEVVVMGSNPIDPTKKIKGGEKNER